MKYRIVRVTKGSKTHYEVQVKGLFWGWNTCTYFDCCIDGSMADDYAHEFKTIEEAQAYINDKNEIRMIC